MKQMKQMNRRQMCELGWMWRLGHVAAAGAWLAAPLAGTASCMDSDLISATEIDAPAGADHDDAAADESVQIDVTAGAAEPADENAVVVASEAEEAIEVGPPPVITALGPSHDETDAEYIFISQTMVLPVTEAHFPVDILFLVDNSYSMGGEILRVQRHLAEFLEDLALVSHLKVALMSAFDDQGTFTFDNEPHVFFDANIPASLIQVNHRVRSWNSLLLASFFYNNHQGMSRDLGLSGDDFFREKSLKMFVVVSDDDAKDMGAAAFYRSLVGDDASAAENFLFYGFVGIPTTVAPGLSSEGSLIYTTTAAPNEACDVVAGGEEYYKLVAQHIKGALFDICGDDWTGYFDKILAGVLAEHGYQFSLDHDPAAVYALEVDGQAIDLSEVSIMGQSLTIGAQALVGMELSQNPEVTVIFKQLKP